MSYNPNSGDADLAAIAALSPSNNDIIQRKAGAWTNRTIAQYYADLQASVKGDVYFFSPLHTGAGMSPADSTTYYYGGGVLSGLVTTDTSVDGSFGVDITIIACIVSISNNTTSGTAEAATFKIRNVTDAASATIGTGATNGSATNTISHTFTGLSIDVDAGDLVCSQIDTPAWVTNPVSMQIRTTYLCKRR